MRHTGSFSAPWLLVDWLKGLVKQDILNESVSNKSRLQIWLCRPKLIGNRGGWASIRRNSDLLKSCLKLELVLYLDYLIIACICSVLNQQTSEQCCGRERHRFSDVMRQMTFQITSSLICLLFPLETFWLYSFYHSFEYIYQSSLWRFYVKEGEIVSIMFKVEDPDSLRIDSPFPFQKLEIGQGYCNLQLHISYPQGATQMHHVRAFIDHPWLSHNTSCLHQRPRADYSILPQRNMTAKVFVCLLCYRLTLLPDARSLNNDCSSILPTPT